MSSNEDSLNKLDLADLIIKVGCDKRGKHFNNIANYLDIIYENWGFETHNTVLHIFELHEIPGHSYHRRTPSYDYYWKNVVVDNPDYPDEYKDLIHKVFCLRVVDGSGIHHAEIEKYFNTIIEKYGNEAYVDAINILGFEEDCWL